VGCDETKKEEKNGAGGDTPLPLARGRKIDDKVKNKIYFKRTQLLRGVPGTGECLSWEVREGG